MKKRTVAVLCLLVAVLALALPWSTVSGAYDEVYIIGVNDTVMLRFISPELMPVRRSGVVYVPYSVLDNQDLELSYALNRAGGTFAIYNRKQTLVFQLNGSGVSTKDGDVYTDHIITRNGVVFIPLRFVTSYFDLTYYTANLSLSDGTVPLIRVCSARASMSNAQFRSSAIQLIATPLRQYMASQATPTPTAPPSQVARPSESPSPTPSAAPEPVDLCFAVLCTDGSGFFDLLSSLGDAHVSALFLFSPDDLAARDDDVRAAAAAGHQIGLLLGREDAAGDFARGNALLSHILRCEATQVAFSGSGAPPEGNWSVWKGNVSLRGSSAAALGANLASDVDGQRVARVTLNDARPTAQAVRRNLAAWSRRPYTIFTPTETG